MLGPQTAAAGDTVLVDPQDGMAAAGGVRCHGPLCALLPLLSAMNLTVTEVQVRINGLFITMMSRHSRVCVDRNVLKGILR
jgi:hypothetical protein